MKVGAVDIGTNSMRLLITDGDVDSHRVVEVTSLGQGVDTTGRLSEAAIERTLDVLGRFGDLMDTEGAGRRKAIATSAARDAANREQFFDRAEAVLGIRPTLISGEDEARLAWEGAGSGLPLGGDTAVCDIGGGSTELVTRTDLVSVDIGSVRLTDRILRNRPASSDEMDLARSHVAALLEPVGWKAGELVGIAGTWTSLAAIDLDLPDYDSDEVDGHRLELDRLERLIDRLEVMTVEATAAIPSLDPKRAPVILAGSVVAAGVLHALELGHALISESDTLDGLAAQLLALP